MCGSDQIVILGKYNHGGSLNLWSKNCLARDNLKHLDDWRLVCWHVEYT